MLSILATSPSGKAKRSGPRVQEKRAFGLNVDRGKVPGSDVPVDIDLLVGPQVGATTRGRKICDFPAGLG
jgi:hypothetical protein